MWTANGYVRMKKNKMDMIVSEMNSLASLVTSNASNVFTSQWMVSWCPRGRILNCRRHALPPHFYLHHSHPPFFAPCCPISFLGETLIAIVSVDKVGSALFLRS